MIYGPLRERNDRIQPTYVGRRAPDAELIHRFVSLEIPVSATFARQP